ncbi:MAG: type VI secretion system baseplate subunit TssF [Pseudomonadota bacterium]
MDTRLLRHYENELTYMREMGAEFAAAYPKIAARLGMEGIEVLDPYVERLLEGTAFLSARVQLELELQFPEFTNHLLEIVYPHYLSPTPSMMIAAFEPDVANAGMKDGYVMKRQTRLRSRLTDGQQTPCEYRTAADLTMWPVQITEAEYIDSRGALVAAGLEAGEARAAIRLRLKRSDPKPIAELKLDTLTLFLDPRSGANWQLFELLSAETTGIAARSTDRRDDWMITLPRGRITPKGFGADEALLPTPRQSFDGYRLLQEYFAMPERFHFVDVEGLKDATAKATAQDVDIYILLRDGQRDVAPNVTPEAFTLNAVPAINLFERRCDRIHVSPSRVEHHIVPSRTAPLDFEVYALKSLTGISGEGQDDVAFRPFYSSDDFTPAGESHTAFFTQRRRMRERSERERLRGARTSYLGSDLFVTVVDQDQAPYGHDLDQLAAVALCTNRDLPLLLSVGGSNLFTLPDGGPVLKVHTPVSPTRPRPSVAQGDAAWRLISHLSLNYLSITDEGETAGAAALREMIGVYAPKGDKVIEKQLEGLVSVASRPIVRRMSDAVLSTAVRGLEIKVEFDESFFEGTSVYLLGSVLERFFRKYTTINSFTETVLSTQQRGEIARWKPADGLGRII